MSDSTPDPLDHPKFNAENDEIWTTLDGRRIPVCELHEDHAKNILRMILRHRREEQDALAALVCGVLCKVPH